MAASCPPTRMSSLSTLDERSRLLLPDLDELIRSDYESITTRTLNERESDKICMPLPLRTPSTYSAVSPLQQVHSPNNCTTWGGNLACQTKMFQLPLTGNNKVALESWTITFHAETTRVATRYHWLGIGWWWRTETEPAHVVSVVPNVHFSQEELAGVCEAFEDQFQKQQAKIKKRSSMSTSSTRSSRSNKITKAPEVFSAYDEKQICYQEEDGVSAADQDLERRLRRLDWAVQDEIYDLLNDRVQSSSNAFRRRDWKVVVLVEVPGGELTCEGSATVKKSPTKRKWLLRTEDGSRRRWVTKLLPFHCLASRKPGERKNKKKLPITEYRLILCGTETKASDEGWGQYNRYSRPWSDIDEKELGEKLLRWRSGRRLAMPTTTATTTTSNSSRTTSVKTRTPSRQASVTSAEKYLDF